MDIILATFATLTIGTIITLFLIRYINEKVEDNFVMMGVTDSRVKEEIDRLERKVQTLQEDVARHNNKINVIRKQLKLFDDIDKERALLNHEKLGYYR